MGSPLEREVQSAIVDIARLLGWRVYHTFDSRKSEAGFPDLVLVRDRVIYAEVKRAGQRPRPSQIDWLNALSRAGAEVYVWTESDYDEVASILSQRVPRTPEPDCERCQLEAASPEQFRCADHSPRGSS